MRGQRVQKGGSNVEQVRGGMTRSGADLIKGFHEF